MAALGSERDGCSGLWEGWLLWALGGIATPRLSITAHWWSIRLSISKQPMQSGTILWNGQLNARTGTGYELQMTVYCKNVDNSITQ